MSILIIIPPFVPVGGGLFDLHWFGRACACLQAASPLYYDRGIGLLSSGLLITAQRSVEIALREDSSLLRLLIKLILRVTLAGKTERGWTGINPASWVSTSSAPGGSSCDATQSASRELSCTREPWNNVVGTPPVTANHLFKVSSWSV